MTDLERRALLGDKQAQEECTEKGIVLPCPFCGGKSSARYTGNNSGFKGFKSNIYMRSNPGYISCERCGVQSTRHNRVCRALKKWNTRSAPPSGRCGKCKHSWNQDEYGYINCTNLHVIMKQNDFCSLFEPKNRSDNNEMDQH